MAEREVLVKLGTKPLPSADEPLKRLAASAQAADKAVQRIGPTGTQAMGMLTASTAKAESRIKQLGLETSRVFDGITSKANLSALTVRKFSDAFNPNMGGKSNPAVSFGLIASTLGEATRIGADFVNVLALITGQFDKINLNAGIFGSIAAPLVGLSDTLTRDWFNVNTPRRQRLETQAFYGDERSRLEMLQGQLARDAVVRGKANPLQEMLARSQLQIQSLGQGPEGRRTALQQQQFMASGERDYLLGRRAEVEDRVRQIQSNNLLIGGGSSDYIDAARQMLLGDAQRQLLDINQKIAAVEERRVNLLKQEGEERANQLRQQIDLHGKEEERLRAIAVQERARLQSLQAAFGLMDPARQMGIRSIAERLGSGQELSRGELQFAQANPSFFAEHLDRIGGERGAAAGFAEIARQIGLDVNARRAEQAARQQAEIKLQIEQRLFAQVELDARSVAAQIAAELQPQILAGLRNVSQEASAQAAAEFRNFILNWRAGG